MKKSFLRIGAAFLASALIFVGCQQNAETIEPFEDQSVLTFETKLIPNTYIVVFKDDVNGARVSPIATYPERQEAMQAISKDFLTELQVASAPERVFSSTVQGFVATNVGDDDVRRIMADDRVKYIEQDREIVMKRPPWERDGGGDDGGSTGETLPPGITRVGGGATYTGSNVAWIVDTGIDLDHEDLNVDASRGFNAFTSGRDGKNLDDGNGHGTHCAGTVAAVDNEVGVVGVAAGATVVPVKVLDSRGSGTFSGVIAGIDHVGANGSAGDVANLSLGGGASQTVDDAVIAASSNGVWFVVAAGNDGSDANNYSPARANGPYILTISAMDVNDNFASFSNWGNPPVDYCAPGVAIESTWKGGGYNTISGTSMATPHAAGVILMSGVGTDGTFVNGDPDGNADPVIAVK